jgi:aromatic-L-amino-acid decarboxylase
MNPALLEEAVRDDLARGLKPVCVVAALGTTGSTAVDPLEEIASVCRKYDLWLHVDAAYAGSALILPEFRWMIKGIENADSLVFNPHKWLFTNFDCSAYFVRDSETLINTFKLVPEYLKTQIPEHVNDYSNWGIQLGRRFRALKLWFVIRSFGIRGLQEKIRAHIALAGDLKTRILENPDFELMAPVLFGLVCFRFHPRSINDTDTLNRLNERLLMAVNGTGDMYITHTKLGENYTLRMSIGQTQVEERHVNKAWELILVKAQSILNPSAQT